MLSVLPVVLSGGSGTRLWPISREKYPKHLFPSVGENLMLQSTVVRPEGLENLAEPLLLCNEEHRFVVAAQARLLGTRGPVLLEPVGRNTAPAMTLAALWARRNGDDPVLVVMPADHVIADGASFRQAVERATRLALAGAAVTFGITPDCAETVSYTHLDVYKRQDCGGGSDPLAGSGHSQGNCGDLAGDRRLSGYDPHCAGDGRRPGHPGGNRG